MKLVTREALMLRLDLLEGLRRNYKRMEHEAATCLPRVEREMAKIRETLKEMNRVDQSGGQNQVKMFGVREDCETSANS